MGENFKDIGKMTRENMGRFSCLMVIYMKENLKMIYVKEKEGIFLTKEIFMMGNGEKEKCKEKE